MEINFANLKIGDRLVREKGGVFTKHHALYTGINKVTGEHYIAENQVNFGVRAISLKQFLQEGNLVKIDYNNFSSYQQNLTIKRIEDRSGESYNLLRYNCEQFVNDVLYGVKESKQVQVGVILLILLLLSIMGFFAKK